MTTLVEIRPAGDSAVVVELGTEIDPTLNAHVIAIAAQLRRERIEGVRDVVSSYAAVRVYFDPVRTNFEALTSADPNPGAAGGASLLRRRVRA